MKDLYFNLPRSKDQTLGANQLILQDLKLPNFPTHQTHQIIL